MMYGLARMLYYENFSQLEKNILILLIFQVQEYLKRFQGIPDLLELDHLTVSGDVWFGKDVTLKVFVIVLIVGSS